MPAISNICSAICASNIKASAMTQSHSDWGDLNPVSSTTSEPIAESFPRQLLFPSVQPILSLRSVFVQADCTLHVVEASVVIMFLLLVLQFLNALTKRLGLISASNTQTSPWGSCSL